MFKILYTLEFLCLSFSIYFFDSYAIIATLAFMGLTLLWNLDKLELTRIQNIIKGIDKTNSDDVTHNPAFKSLSVAQKLIYLTAFKAGVEFILKKLK